MLWWTQSLWEVQTLETLALKTLNDGQFALSTQLIKQIILLYPPPAQTMQQDSLFRN